MLHQLCFVKPMIVLLKIPENAIRVNSRSSQIQKFRQPTIFQINFRLALGSIFIFCSNFKTKSVLRYTLKTGTSTILCLHSVLSTKCSTLLPSTSVSAKSFNGCRYSKNPTQLLDQQWPQFRYPSTISFLYLKKRRSMK